MQLSFDNKGRLWGATMPTYPHYRPGDPKPDDKLLIYEDTDGDGKADNETVFGKCIGFLGIMQHNARDLLATTSTVASTASPIWSVTW